MLNVMGCRIFCLPTGASFKDLVISLSSKNIAWLSIQKISKIEEHSILRTSYQFN